MSIPKTLIVAEIGVNHNGDLGTALELIDSAVDAGANIVKFQTFKAESLVLNNVPLATYQSDRVDLHKSQYEMLRNLELDEEQHIAIVDHCAEREVEFLSTAFDLDSLDFLVKLGVKRFKIPSGEITNLPYLRKIGSYAKSTILSTGMSTFRDIESAVSVLELSGLPRERLVVLHCNSDYPTPLSDVNLRAMSQIREGLRVEVGYSDHTLGIEIAIAAVALGATVIEKHLTLNRQSNGPDHSASLEPAEFKEMVRAIRSIEIALGDGDKRVMPSEYSNKKLARKSLVAKTSIKAGERFSVDNMTTKRPGTGISPMMWDVFLGKKARRDYKKDDLLESE